MIILLTGLLFYTTYISVDIAHHEIFRVKVGMGGIKVHGFVYFDHVNIPTFRGKTTHAKRG